jgi:hypothetical protein
LFEKSAPSRDNALVAYLYPNTHALETILADIGISLMGNPQSAVTEFGSDIKNWCMWDVLTVIDRLI